MQGHMKALCTCIPPLISGFVDAFVDHAVGDVVLGCEAPFPPIPQGKFDTILAPKPQSSPIITKLPKVERIIAIGDVHGDLERMRWALALARVMNDKNEWIGKNTLVVKVGDLLDRGDEELKIIYLLEKLKRQAQRAGDDIHILTGNHEVMNMQGNFTTATYG